MKLRYLTSLTLIILLSLALGTLIFFGKPFTKITKNFDDNFDSKMSLRLELFTIDMNKTITFYKEVLGFHSLENTTNSYQPISNGEVILGIGLLESLGNDHYFEPFKPSTKFGYGIEIVLEVDDIQAAYDKVKSLEVEILGHLKRQPWGLTDFRVADPNGYYIRVTSKK